MEKYTLCVKVHIMCKITQNVKITQCLEMNSSSLNIHWGKIYTNLNFFTLTLLVVLATNISYACQSQSISKHHLSSFTELCDWQVHKSRQIIWLTLVLHCIESLLHPNCISLEGFHNFASWGSCNKISKHRHGQLDNWTWKTVVVCNRFLAGWGTIWNIACFHCWIAPQNFDNSRGAVQRIIKLPKLVWKFHNQSERDVFCVKLIQQT